MTDRFVIDTYALRSVTGIPGSPASVFEPMTDLVGKGRLSFPDAVLRECKEYCRDEPVWTWAYAAEGLRLDRGRLDQSYTDMVLDYCDELADPDDLSEDQPPVRTAAMGLQFRDEFLSDRIFVISEDVRENALRVNLHEACSKLGLPVLRVADFLSHLN